MSERLSRLVLVAFAVLGTAVAGNLILLQPASNAHRMASAPTASWGRVTETAALAVPELDTNVASQPGAAGGVGQRIVIEPPVADQREITRAVQKALEARGYETGGSDGLAGPVTQAAILAYETDHGLALTGEPTEELVSIILNGGQGTNRPAASGSLIPGPKAEALIRQVQASLARLGYPVGPADGRLGAATIGVIRQFEKQQGMPDTGRISGELIVRLTRLASDGRQANRR